MLSRKTIFIFLLLFPVFFGFKPVLIIAAPPEGIVFPSAAVPDAPVLRDEKGDYIIDTPFPQWVRELAPAAGDQATTPCGDPVGLIPSWAAPLPVEPVRCAALSPDGKELWVATHNGVIFLDLENKRRLYFAGKRWLPDNDVISVGVTPDGHALAHTANGDCLIARRMMTLEQKALYFESIMQKRHNREGMFSDAPLKIPGDLNSFYLNDDDNDGQWTEMYLAAESFRFAATGDPEAKRVARQAFLAMKRLLTITPVKGYVARSVLPAAKCPGSDAERWRMLPSGDFCWKSDTSKDELIGHYFGLPLYHDLVADAADKQTTRELIANLTDYIIGNGYRLLDENGKVTTYGNLDPEWINGPYGKMGDQGLNSILALAMARSAFNITRDDKYLSEYKKLMGEHKYHINAMREKEISDRLQVNHDSDEMAALGFYSLLWAENSDIKLRDDFFLEGMRRLWKKDIKERNAEQIIIYGAFAQKDYGLETAVRTLREIPLDLINWGSRNSHRKDIKHSTKLDRFNAKQMATVPPFTEARTVRWSQNLYQLDVDGGGNVEMTPTFWLLFYWMARYHEMIRPASSVK